ncbi:MAG: tetratricopeptide repeat protein [Rhodospirillales bacterium]|jgi:protein O-GlcNAc transferase|nr:tetratricopeptide repeat protein [Rhodospirillales bacterium]MBT4038813.1 tetratricopeptide repeat protein [Rhodospirillales bacterium]MBT4625908.1 tetratricopeptide repeat protein [Rhodospirillales bacterium]MBT5352344.1 tetratricopeptide repeat protein [Rhodospirillales bacterium]MBT5519665.1 tetratricopeptide repeat protein [Rhodospirillales bacterium]
MVKPTPQELQQIINQAQQHHSAGRLQEAEAGYRQVLAQDENNPVALNLLGTIAHQTGNHAAAEELIALAVQRAPKFHEAAYNRGVV